MSVIPSLPAPPDASVVGPSSPEHGHTASRTLAARLAALEIANAQLREENAQLSQKCAADARDSDAPAGPRSPLDHRRTLVLDHDGFDRRLAYEWTRAEHFWTPLSLIVIALRGSDVDDAEGTAGAQPKAAVARWLADACRAVDIPCQLDGGELGLILPATNRTGAEAELHRLAQLWKMTAWAKREALTTSVDLALGMAVAFDEASSPLELLMLADASMVQACRQPAEQDQPTVPCPQCPTLIDAA